MKKVVHITAVHSPQDSRIFYRECAWLAQHHYDVTYVVPADAVPAGQAGTSGAKRVKIERVKKPVTRLGRPLVWFRILAKAIKLQPDILHFHDPELLVMAPVFKLFCGRQCRLVYDVHEYVAASISDKFWIPQRLRGPAAWLVARLEKFFGQWVDGQVFVVNGQLPYYKTWKTCKIILPNYPDLDNFAVPFVLKGPNRPDQPFTLVHIGSLYERRGIMTMLKTLVLLKKLGYYPRLVLGGVFESELFQHRVTAFIRDHGLAEQVQILGWIDYKEIRHYLKNADALWLAHYPTVQHARQSVCTKQVEAMVAGLPAVVSDIPSLTRFVQESGGGLVVRPLDPAAHANAVKWLMDHPDRAAQMGAKARNLAVSRYVWQKQAWRLGALYDQL